MANNVVIGDLGKLRGNDCLRFNGVDSAVKILSTPLIDDFNVAMKITPYDLANPQFLWANRNGADTWVRISGGKIATGARIGGSDQLVIHPTVLQINKEYSVTVTKSGDNYVVTVDGVVHNGSTTGVPASTSDGWQSVGLIDFGSGTKEYFDGCMRQLTVDESVYITQGSFGDATLVDYGVNGLDGTLTNTIWWKQGVDEVYATPTLYRSTLPFPAVEEQNGVTTDAVFYPSDDPFWNPYNQDATYGFTMIQQQSIFSILDNLGELEMGLVTRTIQGDEITGSGVQTLEFPCDKVYLSTSGTAGVLSVHYSGDGSKGFRDIDIPAEGAFLPYGSIDKVDVDNSTVVFDSKLIFGASRY